MVIRFLLNHFSCILYTLLLNGANLNSYIQFLAQKGEKKKKTMKKALIMLEKEERKKK